MDTQLQSLSKIFTEKIFRIPDYQRGFAWEERQLLDFWNDIVQLEDGRNHYTGVLTLEEVPQDIVPTWEDDQWIVKAKSFQPFYVVDGQQRLTTAIILIQVILERIDRSEKLNYTSHTEIQKKFIFDSKDDGISRSYIFGYEKDNPSYEFLKTRIFVEHSSTSIDARETVYTHNLENSKQFFASRLKGLPHTEVEKIYRKVTQHLLFNIFTIAEDVDVCVAFETMNNRGKPLSYLELLKNRLIYLSLMIPAEEYEKNDLRKAINDCWKSLYHNLGKNKDKPLDDDLFLYNHCAVHFGTEALAESRLQRSRRPRYERYRYPDYASFLLEKKFIQRNLSKEIDPKNRVTLKGIYQFVSSLQISVELWYKIFNPSDSDFSRDIKIWLDKLNRLGLDQFGGLIMVFFQKESSTAKRMDLLREIERRLFLNSLIVTFGLALRPFEVMEWAIALSRGKTSPEKVIKNLQDSTHFGIEGGGFYTELRSEWRRRGSYVWPAIRYFLYEYNLDLQAKSKTNRPKIFWPEFTEDKSDFVSVEHIYPQRPQHEYWQVRFGMFSSKQRTALRNSLGNLLPLSRPKNSSLQNKPFPQKVDMPGTKGIGYRYGSYAENEVSKSPEWTPETILERGLSLLEFMEKRWHLQLGDRAEKIDLLDLEFMKEKRRRNGKAAARDSG